MTFQTGRDVTLRAQFMNTGKLLGSLDTNFRAIRDNWPVFAFAKDLGPVKGESEPVVFAIGHIRDPAINYITANNVIQQRSLYFWSAFSDAPAMVRAEHRQGVHSLTLDGQISSFLSDYFDALDRANTFDAKVQKDSEKISAEYAAIVSLSIRQAFAAIEITISKDSSGAFDTTDIVAFMKGTVIKRRVDLLTLIMDYLLTSTPTFRDIEQRGTHNVVLCSRKALIWSILRLCRT